MSKATAKENWEDGAVLQVTMDGQTYVEVYKTMQEAFRGSAEQVLRWIKAGNDEPFSKWPRWTENRSKYLAAVADHEFWDAHGLVVMSQSLKAPYQIHIDMFRFRRPKSGAVLAKSAYQELGEE